MNVTLNGYDWNELNDMELNDATNIFYLRVSKVIDTFTPLANFKRKYPTWYSSALIRLLKLKEKARYKWKATLQDPNYLIYSGLRSQSKLLVSQCYKDYLIHLQDTTPQNVKTFRTFTKSKRHTNSYPNELTLNGMNSSDPPNMCQMFANYFQSTYTSNTGPHTVPTAIPTSSRTSTQINRIYIAPDNVERHLSTLDLNKQEGPDGVPNIFAIMTRESLSLPLSILFNKSLSSGVVPERFKMALVTPIHKKEKNWK